jgi:hypothetical protein
MIMSSITTQTGQPQTNFSCSDRGTKYKRKTHKCGDNTTFICPDAGAVYQIPVPRRVRHSGVLVAPRSVFAVFVGWSSGAKKSGLRRVLKRLGKSYRSSCVINFVASKAAILVFQGRTYLLRELPYLLVIHLWTLSDPIPQ